METLALALYPFEFLHIKREDQLSKCGINGL